MSVELHITSFGNFFVDGALGGVQVGQAYETDDGWRAAVPSSQGCQMIDAREKVVLFVDGPNLYSASKALGIELDFKRLLADFQSKAFLLRAYYYTAITEDQEYSSLRPLLDWLRYNGFAVVTKPTKEFTDAAGRRRIRGSIGVELAVDALELAPYYDHLILFSGDGDFTALVASLQRCGKRVTVVSTLVTPSPMIADDLRRQADFFLDLADLAKVAGRLVTGHNTAAKP